MKKSPLPNIPECILKKKGICYDLASLATAVCRKFGIKAAMIIGTSSGVGFLRGAHAWINVYIDGKEILYDPTADAAKKKMAQNYKEERRY